MSNRRGKQQLCKNIALSRTYKKGVRMKLCWKETLKNSETTTKFGCAQIQPIPQQCIIFHHLVFPLGVYLHLNQPNIWWRTAWHVSNPSLGQHHFRINERLNALSREFSDLCGWVLHIHLQRQMGFGAGDKGRTAGVANSTCTTHSGSRKKVKTTVCCRLDKNTFKIMPP